MEFENTPCGCHPRTGKLLPPPHLPVRSQGLQNRARTLPQEKGRFPPPFCEQSSQKGRSLLPSTYQPAR